MGKQGIILLLCMVCGSAVQSFGNNKLIYLHFFGLDDEKIFSLESSWNRDNCVKPFVDLKNALKDLGYTLKAIKNVQDIKEEPLCVVAFNILPSFLRIIKQYPASRFIAFLWEPPIKKYALNFDSSMYHYFSKIYTWNDALVDNTTFFKLYWPQPSLDFCADIQDFDHKKLCVMINRYQESVHPLELCSERLKVVNFFEEQEGNDFDFYGNGWPAERYKNYKGPVVSKLDILKKYKYCICYENAKDLDGYITEKIFDCFTAGCVPVYLGCRNIDSYVPRECFIDRRDFESMDELYRFLQSITKQEYEAYLDNIKCFLAGSQAQFFSISHFIKTFVAMLPDDRTRCEEKSRAKGRKRNSWTLFS